MKLEHATATTLASDDFQTLPFLVDQKTAQIFFRDKMYTADGKLRVMAQEYMANARDAHREVGKFNAPIEVHLPTTLAPEYVVRDYGPGISEERIQKVFRIYGKSTKNGSNYENGGFGLGAKCAFSYSNAFALTTISNGIKYVYSGYIDDNSENQLALLHQEPTSEPSGTEIKIPINTQDIDRFSRWVHEITHFWEPRPAIKRGKVFYRASREPLFTGAGWSVRKSDDISYFNNTGGIYVLLDGIPYRVPEDDAQSCSASTHKLLRALASNNLALILPYKVGELTIYPSREFLHYTDKTKRGLVTRVDQFLTEITGSLKKQYAAAPDILAAYQLYRKWGAVQHAVTHVNPVLWNNVPFSLQLSGHCGVEVYSGEVSTRGDYYCVKGMGRLRLYVSLDHVLRGDNNCQRYFTADTTLTPKKIKAAIRRDERKGRVMVLVIKDAQKAAAIGLTPDILRRLEFTEVTGPPKTKTKRERKAIPEHVYVQCLHLSVRRCGDQLVRCSEERKRVFFSAFKDLVFVHRKSVEALDGTVSYVYQRTLPDGTVSWIPQQQFIPQVYLARLVRANTVARPDEYQGDYKFTLAVWEDRFDDYTEDPSEFLTSDTIFTEAAFSVMTCTPLRLSNLVVGGLHVKNLKEPGQWLWKDVVARRPPGLPMVVKAFLRLSALNVEFKAHVEAYLNTMHGLDYTKGGWDKVWHPAHKELYARYQVELLAALGGEAYMRITELVGRFNDMTAEFLRLFEKAPLSVVTLQALWHEWTPRGVDCAQISSMVEALLNTYAPSPRFAVKGTIKGIP